MGCSIFAFEIPRNFVKLKDSSGFKSLKIDKNGKERRYDEPGTRERSKAIKLFVLKQSYSLGFYPQKKKGKFWKVWFFLV